MPRFRIPLLLRQRLRFYQTIDVYTHRPLTWPERSIEHIIPVSFSPYHRNIQLDPLHLYLTSPSLNGFRSNFRFGGHPEETFGNHWSEREGCFRNTVRRVFLPAKGRRLVAHVLWNMMDKHPELRDRETQLIENNDVWNDWLKTPWTPMERRVLDMNTMLHPS
jgi:endonuclease I